MTGKIMIAALLALLPASALAETKTVTVDARSGPWSVKANPGMPYGIGDAGEPAILKGIDGGSGQAAIYTDGKITVGGTEFGASGDDKKEVDDNPGRKGKRFPSFYTPKVLYPANAHGLVGVFTDDKGKIIGRPFMIGSGVRVPMPDGATELSLGFNDDSFAANSGSVTVQVELPD